MMNFPGRAALSTVLAAAFLCFAAAPATAQVTQLARGFGSYVGQNQENKVISFRAHEHANGDVHGSCLMFEPSSHGLVRIQVTSSAMLGDTLFLAGPITHAINSPPFIVVGATAMFGVTDNGGWGSQLDEFVGPAFPPASLGNLTAQQILGIIGSPPPQAFQPLQFGNIRIF
ncbi:MAG: hypothetical protein ACI85K_003145 [Hyphomicrobiaceae bacterium]|jgi:hypothetical protein